VGGARLPLILQETAMATAAAVVAADAAVCSAAAAPKLE